MKKLLASLLVLTLCLGSFTACNTEKKAEKNDGTTKLKWIVPMGEKQEDMERVLSRLNEKLKTDLAVSLELEVIEFPNYDEKMNLIISAGENYDLAFSSGNWINKYFMRAEKKELLQLDEYIEDLSDTLNEIPKSIMENLRYTDKLYGIPNYQICYSQAGVHLRKDLVDKTGFDVKSVPQEKYIETLKALEPFFEKVKVVAPEIYPYRCNLWPAENGIEPLSTVPAVGDFKNGDVVVKSFDDSTMEEEWENLFASWYKKGYIRQDLATVSAENENADVSALKYACLTHPSIKPGGKQDAETRDGVEYIEIAVTSPVLNMGSGLGAITVINSKTKNPKKAVEFLNYINTNKEAYNLICYGIEGEHYTKNSEGKIKASKNSKYNPNVSWVFGNQFNAYLLDGQADDTWEKTKELNEIAKTSPLLGFQIDFDPIKTNVASLTSIESEYKNIFVYPNYEQLKKDRKEKREIAGINDVVKELQKQYDGFKLKK